MSQNIYDSSPITMLRDGWELTYIGPQFNLTDII